MAAINNLKGTIIKDGKVVYSEQIEMGLHFAIIVMYSPFYTTNYHQESTQIMCEAVMTTGARYVWGNGVNSLEEAKHIEVVKTSEDFKPLREDLTTRDGFRIWQNVTSYREFEEIEEDVKVKYKSRSVQWLIEVPKLSMLNYCGI